ncbi:hybrid sensor histidine kinase/response regulator [Granulicella sp. L46]|uniref:ATP-binding response regulator n=1 Tax=Granulicella sp. L46 TaxID=1641865 RepID=UPI00131BA3B9|nr:hybrid sensor histidine kinase/response regulator [Granulicella sp. L46]
MSAKLDRQNLTILLVEDNPDDAALLERHLRRHGLSPSIVRVENAVAMQEALSREALPDIVLGDYNLPNFSGPAALQLLKTSAFDIPFIMLSGAVSEQTAVDSMRAGAQDYVSKENLTRLIPAVEREIKEASGRRQAEATLRRSEQHLQLAMEGAGLGMWSYDPREKTFSADATMQRIFGSISAVGDLEFWSALLHPDDREMAASRFSGAMTEGAPYDVEYRVIRPDGVRWIRSKGRVVGIGLASASMFAIVEDVTDKKQSEEAFKTIADRLLLAQAAGRIASWEWELATGDFIWDGGTEWTYGRSTYEMSHVDKIFSYLHAEDRARVRNDLIPAIEGRGEYRSQFRVIWPDGSTHWLDAWGKSVFSPDGTVTRLIGINVDITDRKLAEKALIQNEKLAAVGRLASSIAHEINNPLESVTNLLYLAEMSQSPQDVREYLAAADIELQRVSAITNQTLRFHKQSTNPTEMNSHALIESILALHNSRLTNSRIKTEKQLRCLRTVFCFEGEIRQVLNNLISNALDAMHSEGGRLLVRCHERRDWRSGRTGISITVADDGPGMASETVSKVFDAFFTTKGIGGTGLGLWISQEIIQRHQGRLLLRSSQRLGRRGTVFSVFLPFNAVAR